MRKKIFLTALASVVMLSGVSAKKATKEYQRPSLHMVLLTADAEKAKNTGSISITDPEIMGYVSNSWKNYEFPSLYNEFKIPFKEANAGAPKGSIMELVNMYNKPGALDNMQLDQMKAILEMTKGKAYKESIKHITDSLSNEVAHQLVSKWWSIQEDGTCSDTLLFRLACYSATQNAANDAAMTTMGAQTTLFNKLSGPTMNNTYVTFSKLDFYENEPIAMLVKNLTISIATIAASQSPMGAELAIAGATKGAEELYNKTKEGYTACATTALYKLNWNDSIANEFYGLWKDGNHIDMEKFKAMKFELVFMGMDNSTTTCFLKKEDKGQGAEHMVTKTIHKSLNKMLAAMQKQHEEFRPMVPVLGVDADGFVFADMGTKESIVDGDKFSLLLPVTDAEGLTSYKTVGKLKVIKGGVYDNENIDNAAEADANMGASDLKGTKLSKNKKATPSMFVKKQK